jgi:histidyl-tRNA synthetase
MITQRPKGTQDWYGSSMHKRTIIEALARKTLQSL